MNIAFSSEADAYIGQARAVELYGTDYGLDGEDHLTAFENHATASQVLLGGQADVLSGGLTQTLQLIQEGENIKVFCPVQRDSTEHLAGLTKNITSLDQITDPNIRVAVDSPGGLINFIMNLVFRERGLTNDAGEPLTVDDLQNVVILEDGGLRLAALAADEVDVGSVDLFEQADLKAQIGEDAVTILSIPAEDGDFLANSFTATEDWLTENPDAAAAFCASVLRSNRELSADFDTYSEVVDTYIEGGVEEETLRTNWEFAREFEVWPLNCDALSQENIDTEIEVSVASGLLDPSAEDLSFEDIVDTSYCEAALGLLGD